MEPRSCQLWDLVHFLLGERAGILLGHKFLFHAAYWLISFSLSSRLECVKLILNFLGFSFFYFKCILVNCKGVINSNYLFGFGPHCTDYLQVQINQ